ncbi:MAG: acetoacetyl-CoA reductase [Alphaproteobacteria bacterium]
MSQVAIVTGGTRGIGAAISKALVGGGYHVAAVYHSNDEKARAFQEETGISVWKWEVNSFEACQKGVAEVEEKLGPISVLVNNAGITRDAMLHKMTPEDWHAVMETNLSSLFYMCRTVIEGMRERTFGRIVNISSVNALKGQRGQTNYSASKAGVIGFTKALAQESASYGITVNAVAPGYVDTEMVRAVSSPVMEKILDQIPLKRLGKAEEIGKMVSYLVSPEASFVTGATFSINGGQFMA